MIAKGGLRSAQTWRPSGTAVATLEGRCRFCERRRLQATAEHPRQSIKPKHNNEEISKARAPFSLSDHAPDVRQVTPSQLCMLSSCLRFNQASTGLKQMLEASVAFFLHKVCHACRHASLGTGIKLV